MKIWYLYLVRCADGTLYTGITTDVERRLAAHQQGRGARYLRGRAPLALARKLRVGSHGDALRLERRVKRMPRAGKENLIRGKLKIKELRGKIAKGKKSSCGTQPPAVCGKAVFE